MGHVKVYETPPKSAEAAIRKAVKGYTTEREWFVVPSDHEPETMELAANVADILAFGSSEYAHVRPLIWQGRKCLIAFAYDDRED